MPDLRDSQVTLQGRGEARPEDVAAVASGARLRLSASVSARLREERAALDAAIARGAPVYGVTHGLGARSGQLLAVTEPHEFAAQTIRGRAHAVGPALDVTTVRAAIAARVVGFAGGGSGVSPHVAEALVALLDAGVTPVVPSIGSIGLSDLCQFAHVGLVTIGEGGAVVGDDAATITGAAALRAAAIPPLRLAAKDGLTLCGGNPVAAGAGSLAVVSLRRLVEWAEALLALSMSGFAANPSPLHPEVVRRRGGADMARVAEVLRTLTGSPAAGTHDADIAPLPPRRLQDPVSFRAAAASLAALHRALRLMYDEVTAELNGSGDNPVVVGEEVLPTGNFHTPALAQACDGLALALAAYANSVVGRCQRFLQPALTELPVNLTAGGPDSSGLAPVAKVAQALLLQLRRQASPWAHDAREGAEAVEDDATNASVAAVRLLAMSDLFARLLAVEAVHAAQAVDLRPAPLHGPLATLHAALRQVSPPLAADRSLGAELESLAVVMTTSRPATHPQPGQGD